MNQKFVKYYDLMCKKQRLDDKNKGDNNSKIISKCQIKVKVRKR